MKITIEGTTDEVQGYLSSAGTGRATALPAGDASGNADEEVRSYFREFSAAVDQAAREARGDGGGIQGTTRAARDAGATGGGRVRAETRNRLEAVVGDGFTLVDPAGNLLDRADMMDDFTSGRTDFQIDYTDEVMRTFHGHTALWIRIANMRGKVNGVDFTGRYRSVETFVRGPGGWQIVASNLTALKGSDSARV